eukprot:tig00021582_g22613.t1
MRAWLLFLLALLVSSAHSRKLLEVKEGSLEGDDGVKVDVSGEKVTVQLSLQGVDAEGLDVGLDQAQTLGGRYGLLFTLRSSTTSQMGPLAVQQTSVSQKFVPLPCAVDVRSAKAAFENGVLSVELKRSGETEAPAKQEKQQTSLAELAGELARGAMEGKVDPQAVDAMQSRMEEYERRTASRLHSLWDRILPRISGYLQGIARADVPAIAGGCGQLQGDERAECLLQVIRRLESVQRRREEAMEVQAQRMARHAAVSGFLAAVASCLLVSLIARCVKSIDRREDAQAEAQPVQQPQPAPGPAPAPTPVLRAPSTPAAPAPATAPAPTAAPAPRTPRVYPALPQAAPTAPLVDAPIAPEVASLPALQPVPVYPQLAPAERSPYGPAPGNAYAPSPYNPYAYPAGYPWPYQTAPQPQTR